MCFGQAKVAAVTPETRRLLIKSRALAVVWRRDLSPQAWLTCVMGLDPLQEVNDDIAAVADNDARAAPTGVSLQTRGT